MYDFESEAKFKTKTKGKNKNALLLCLLWEHAKCLCKPFFSLYFSSGFCCCFIFVLVNVLLNFFSVCAFMHVFVYSYTLSQKEYYSDWNVRACFIFILDFFCFSLLSTGCLVFAMCIDILHPIQICTLPYILCWVSILKLNCEYRNFWLGSITFVLLFFFVEKAKKIASIRLTSFFEHFSFVCCEILCEIKTPLTNLLLHAITLWSENENARHFSSHSHFLNDPFAVDW